MSTYAQRVQLGPFFSGGTLQGAALLYHYEPGSTTVVEDIWSDRDKNTALAQPFVADANGIFNFYADGLYDIVIKTSAGVTLHTLPGWQFLDGTDPTFSEGVAIASSSSISVGPEIWSHISGSTNIDLITGTAPWYWMVFDGTLKLNHSSSLICPESVNLHVVPGSVVLILKENDAGTVWRVGGVMMIGKATDIASAATITPPSHGSFVDITGTATIEGIAASRTGHEFTARFTNSAGLNLLHHSTSFICPFATDYRVVQNEVVKFISTDIAGYWIVVPLAGAPHSEPGIYLDGHYSAAPVGALLCGGAAINCTTYMALAKKLVPSASTLGNSGTSVGTFTANAGTDVITCTGHGLAVNDLVHVTTSAADLPLNLVINTVYYVKTVPTADTLTLSATRGGATFDIGDAGTGTHTLHNKVNLPDQRGKVRIALDNLGGSAASVITSASTNGGNSTTLAAAGGAQTHTLVSNEMPAHTHAAGSGTLCDTSGGVFNARAALATGLATGSTGGDGAHSNTQPWMAVGSAIRF